MPWERSTCKKEGDKLHIIAYRGEGNIKITYLLDSAIKPPFTVFLTPGGAVKTVQGDVSDITSQWLKIFTQEK
jgi:hypothetical protein